MKQEENLEKLEEEVSTTVTKIINIIKLAIRAEIAKEVKEAKFFSILMDTTMDVSSYDQCVIVLRYLLGTEVQERMFEMCSLHYRGIFV
ncbi:hypothetical protein PR048_006056 [Dryococelus australis]|uniref:DUF4371 domain-containing protein n=1 Tax=Dryococelus australis TaxID=614101 RepID=A0ABQ9I9W9_9NEOP|nr:hypothetical protein PR048_006056 [Dryococelus australis]